MLPGRLHGSRGARHARRRRTVRPRPETRGARSLARRLGAVSRPASPADLHISHLWHSGSRVGCLVRHRARPHRRGGRRPTATVTPRRPRPRAGRRTLMCKTDVMTIVNGKRARAGGPGRQQERCVTMTVTETQTVKQDSRYRAKRTSNRKTGQCRRSARRLGSRRHLHT